MPNPRVYGTPMGDQKPSNATDRQTVQPPSEAYIRAQMSRQRRQASSEDTKAVAKAPDADSPTRDLRVSTAAKRLAGRGRQIDKAVDDAS